MIGFGTYLNDYLVYNGITQSYFAFQLGVSQKHLNEIINGKSDMSIDLMYAIAILTDIDLNFIVSIEKKNKLSKHLFKKFGDELSIKKYLNRFKMNELSERNWVTFNNVTNSIENASDILDFLKIRNFDIVAKYKEKILFKENGNKVELLSLWLARCDSLASKQTVKEYDKSNLLVVIDVLNRYIYNNTELNIKFITKLLNDNGIYLVIENALKTTSARGAFKVFKGKPAIYLTKYYKRLDGIIFSLYHEMGHIKSDYNQGKSKVIIDGTQIQEDRADKFAFNSMIDTQVFRILKKTSGTEKELLEISKKYMIPMCYIISALAKEGIIEYRKTLYNKYIVKIDSNLY